MEIIVHVFKWLSIGVTSGYPMVGMASPLRRRHPGFDFPPLHVSSVRGNTLAQRYLGVRTEANDVRSDGESVVEGDLKIRGR